MDTIASSYNSAFYLANGTNGDIKDTPTGASPFWGDRLRCLNLTWPNWASNWSLFATTNLNPPIVWSTTTNAVGSNASGFSVSVPTGTGAQFFRLSSP